MSGKVHEDVTRSDIGSGREEVKGIHPKLTKCCSHVGRGDTGLNAADSQQVGTRRSRPEIDPRRWQFSAVLNHRSHHQHRVTAHACELCAVLWKGNVVEGDRSSEPLPLCNGSRLRCGALKKE